MLTSKDMLTLKGQPVLVGFEHVSDSPRGPESAYVFSIDVPADVVREHRAHHRKLVEAFAEMSGVEIPESVLEALDEEATDEKRCIRQPVYLCWN